MTKNSGQNKAKKNKAKKNIAWGGRFSASTDIFVEQFTQSVSYDQRLYHYDILGSVAHVSMLAKVGVLSREESEQIVAGLELIEEEIAQGDFMW
jgi:argininosuccinate lyase